MIDPDLLILVWICVIGAGAVVSWLKPAHARLESGMTLLLSIVAFGLWAKELPLNTLIRRDLLAVALLSTGALLVTLPQRPGYKMLTPDLLCAHAGQVIFFTQDDRLGLACGWILSLAPVFRAWWSSRASASGDIPRSFFLAQLLATLLLIVGLIGIQLAGLLPSSVQAPAGILCHMTVVAAGLLRQGLFPAHVLHLSWMDRGPLPLRFSSALAPMGIFVVAESVRDLASSGYGEFVKGFTWFLIGSLCVYALLNLAQHRLATWVGLAQASISTLALVFWIQSGEKSQHAAQALLSVNALGTSGLLYLLWLIELRLGPEGSYEDGGIAMTMPRLAGMILVFGLTMVGLPLTLGYVAEDLWLHESHHLPWLAISLLIVSYVMIGMGFYRIYSTRIFGRATLPASSDLLLREKLALTALFLPLMILGVAPHILGR